MQSSFRPFLVRQQPTVNEAAEAEAEPERVRAHTQRRPVEQQVHEQQPEQPHRVRIDAHQGPILQNILAVN